MDKFKHVAHNDKFIRYLVSHDYSKEILGNRYREGDQVYIVIYISPDGDSIIGEICRENEFINFALDESIVEYVLEFDEKQGYR